MGSKPLDIPHRVALKDRIMKMGKSTVEGIQNMIKVRSLSFRYGLSLILVFRNLTRMWAYRWTLGLQVMATRSWPLSCTGSTMTGSSVCHLIMIYDSRLLRISRGTTYWLSRAAWGSFWRKFGPCSLRHSYCLWSQGSRKSLYCFWFHTPILTTNRL